MDLEEEELLEAAKITYASRDFTMLEWSLPLPVEKATTKAYFLFKPYGYELTFVNLHEVTEATVLSTTTPMFAPDLTTSEKIEFASTTVHTQWLLLNE